jgi:hypothetical protein
MSRKGSFKDIQFGFSSAEAERAEDPGLLLEGYLQQNNAFESAQIQTQPGYPDDHGTPRLPLSLGRP